VRYRKAEAKEYARERMRGLWGASLTPFTPDLQIDETGLRANLRHWLHDLRLGGIFVSGKQGEFFSLSLAERKRTFEIAVEEAQGASGTIMSCWDMNLQNTLELIRHAEAIGADFVIVQSPILYFGAHTDETVSEYFRYLSDRVNIGIALWNNPDHGYTMSARLCARLADLPNIVAIKDSVPRPEYAELTRLAGDRILVSNPSEDEWLDNVLELGWRVYLASPPAFLMQTREDRRLQEYTDLAIRGEAARARQARDSLEPVRHALKTSRPVGKQQAQLKYWQELLGQVGGPVRPPLLQLTEEEKARIRHAFQGCGLARTAAADAKGAEPAAATR
jgi:4-hydroxy-tetrahydrodipicolinate synthase